MTARQDDVRRALATSDAFRSAQDIHAALRAAGSKIGLTTVYRTLRSLCRTGEIDVLRTDDGEAVYRACRTEEHHHHLVCRDCGATIEVEGPAVESWAAATGARHGFTGVTHSIEIFGTCPDCVSRT